MGLALTCPAPLEEHAATNSFQSGIEERDSRRRDFSLVASLGHLYLIGAHTLAQI